ncbi:MAG TPA: type II secretion system protein GspG [Candidatus Hydrogenedentes bacterium]|jgi:general secretion pathway protein G|nr:type II secretion system protein GspG [Candidatus Hydrogenedentota bacterium]HOM49441.1 type II secretion system protein GspG [Candidatus Hydrogenedentota bacterium]HOR50677.1 type II secretion system protein GspG [Candidatus Hydrogenedentota bacterium]HPK24541.1 type II secretion system protein GspG [Candidatus Hydrogenedentota bacterium]HQB03921.1 type II secretion system protein GspG [Candidatus Hydrogenedentota bacterium]
MKTNSGFTLIELILVTVIIGILAGMVVANYSGRIRETQIRAAKGDISTLSTQVDLYALDNNDSYPKTLEDLITGKRRYVRELQPDPWGNPYYYAPPTDILKADYKIYSAGPDGVPGNEDDVTSTSPMP